MNRTNLNKKKLNKTNSFTDMEHKLFDAAAQLPGPTQPVPVSPLMRNRQKRRVNGALNRLRHIPAWQAALLIIAILFLGSTTVLASSPELRAAVIRFFSSGTVETPPAELLSHPASEDGNTDENQSSIPDGGSSSIPSSEVTDSQESLWTVQNDDYLTVTNTITLDDHFAATYISSPNYIEIVNAPSKALLLSIIPEEEVPRYYCLKNGALAISFLKTHSLTASVQPGILPGVMDHDGSTALYRDLQLPEMTFSVVWQQYEDDILINYNATDSEHRFDIGSTYGVSLGNDYDGCFSFRAFPDRSDVIQVSFYLDSQRTEYCYPFLVNLSTGQVIDLLAAVDLSAYACITELMFTDDLTQATAMAGSDHDHLQEITIHLADGTITESPAPKPPVDNSLLWFATSDTTVFYTVGSYEEGMDGFLYDAETQTTTTLFTDTLYNYNAWEEGYGQRFFTTLGGGYCVYYEKDDIYLMNLQNGSRTLLEGVPLTKDMYFFFNPDHSLLEFDLQDENGQTIRLGFIDPVKGEAWFFDREPVETIRETGAQWYGSNVYAIRAEDENTGMQYLYLYEYTP